jgi:hypothetical protein
VADALAYASEHPDGIAQARFVDSIFKDAAWRSGTAELGELAVRTDMCDWLISTWNNVLNAAPDWRKSSFQNHDFRLDMGAAIDGERLDFATVKVDRRRLERF